MNETINIGFTGDICFSGNFRKKVENNLEIFSPELLDAFKASDFIVCNFEGPATTHKNKTNSNVDVVNPPTSIEYLKKRNFNIFNLANNHLFDCGAEGFTETRNLIKENKLQSFGAGVNLNDASEILYITKSNQTIALIGFCDKEGMIAGDTSPGIFCVDENSLIKKKIAEARTKANHVIINYHGGEEFTLLPMPARRNLVQKLASLKPDLIICHHPHVFQGIEKIDNTLIFYSLGNFVFDIPQHDNRSFTEKSAFLNIIINEGKISYDLIPIAIDKENGLIHLSGKQAFWEHITRLSNFKNYYSNWLRETYRVYAEEKQIQANLVKSGKSGKKNIKILSPAYYIIILSTLINPKRRSLVTGALYYKILHKFNLRNED